MSLTVLGYDLLNEPIAHFFDNKDELNNYLEPLYMKVTGRIREVDKIILLSGEVRNGIPIFRFSKIRN